MEIKQTKGRRPQDKAPDKAGAPKDAEREDAANTALAGDDLPKDERIEHQNDLA